MSFTVQKGDTFRDFTIFLLRKGKRLHVEHMFDAGHEETFDPTEAEDVSVNYRMMKLRPGDELVFVLGVRSETA